MPWNPLTAGQVQAEILPQEAAVINAIQGSTTVLAGIVTNFVAAVQGQITALGRPVDQPGTIPDQIRNEAIDICRWRWFASLPSKSLQTDARKKQGEDGEAALKALWKDILDGKGAIELPLTPVTPQTGSAIGAMQVASTGRKKTHGINHVL